MGGSTRGRKIMMVTQVNLEDSFNQIQHIKPNKAFPRAWRIYEDIT